MGEGNEKADTLRYRAQKRSGETLRNQQSAIGETIGTCDKCVPAEDMSASTGAGMCGSSAIALWARGNGIVFVCWGRQGKGKIQGQSQGTHVGARRASASVMIKRRGIQGN